MISIARRAEEVSAREDWGRCRSAEEGMHWEERRGEQGAPGALEAALLLRLLALVFEPSLPPLLLPPWPASSPANAARISPRNGMSKNWGE